ncbi:MAG: 7-carboxy-7-deazaguanine synthase [Nevskia sp.]|nr:7-carboxy-7-deazaguanine synthase [Nevskia sp.]
MIYAVKEIFYTLQGEGANAGRPAVFCRFAGCNLWSGRESDRASAICNFCDTDFVGTDGSDGGKYLTAAELADRIASCWPHPITPHRFVVLTGGEPLLQVDTPLIEALHERCFKVAVETNGTIAAPLGIDWLCVSPKGRAEIKQRSGQELKLVVPQPELDPRDFESWEFERFFLQAMDGPHQRHNLAIAIAYCQAHPQWSLSVQVHKSIGIR